LRHRAGVREKLKPRLAEALGVSIQTLRRWEAPTKNQKGVPETRVANIRLALKQLEQRK